MIIDNRQRLLFQSLGAIFATEQIATEKKEARKKNHFPSSIFLALSGLERKRENQDYASECT